MSRRKLARKKLEEFFILSDLTIRQADEASADSHQNSIQEMRPLLASPVQLWATSKEHPICAIGGEAVVEASKSRLMQEVPTDPASIGFSVMSSEVETSLIIIMRAIKKTVRDSRLRFAGARNDKMWV